MNLKEEGKVYESAHRKERQLIQSSKKNLLAKAHFTNDKLPASLNSTLNHVLNPQPIDFDKLREQNNLRNEWSSRQKKERDNTPKRKY